MKHQGKLRTRRHYRKPKRRLDPCPGPTNVQSTIRRKHARRLGLTAIEYCFMLSLIFLAVVLAVQHLGNMLNESFKSSDTKMSTYMSTQ